jgi:hypothetical protein
LGGELAREASGSACQQIGPKKSAPATTAATMGLAEMKIPRAQIVLHKPATAFERNRRIFGFPAKADSRNHRNS